MQIHELNSFVGTPSSTDYLAIDDGNTTTKVPATSLGVSTAMTQAEAEAGTITGLRVISPSVFKSAVLAIAKTIADTWLPQSVVHIVETGTTGIWQYRKWSDGTYDAWGKLSATGLELTQQSGGTYYSATSVALPNPSFSTGITSVELTPTAPLQSGIFVYRATANNIDFRAHSSMSNASATAFVQIRGTW